MNKKPYWAGFRMGRRSICMPFLISFETTGYTLARRNSVCEQPAVAIIMSQAVTMNAKNVLTLARLPRIPLPST